VDGKSSFLVLCQSVDPGIRRLFGFLSPLKQQSPVAHWPNGPAPFSLIHRAGKSQTTRGSVEIELRKFLPLLSGTP